jgi:hypothetical protein
MAEPKMNIVEAYIKFKHQLIIMFSGLPGTGFQKLAKEFSRDLNIPSKDLNDFMKKDFEENITLPSGKIFETTFVPNAYDWDEVNQYIAKKKGTGVILYGYFFPISSLTEALDFHIHLTLPKQEAMKKYLEYTKYNSVGKLIEPAKKPEYTKETTSEFNFDTSDTEIVDESIDEESKMMEETTDKITELDTETEKVKDKKYDSMVFNQAVYPIYLEQQKLMQITRFIKILDLSLDKVYDESFEYIIQQINKYLYKDRKKQKTISPVMKYELNDKNAYKKMLPWNIPSRLSILTPPDATVFRNPMLTLPYEDPAFSPAIPLVSISNSLR